MDGCDLIAGPVDSATCEDLCTAQETKTEAGIASGGAARENCAAAYEMYLDCAGAVDWSAQICDSDNKVTTGCEDEHGSWEKWCEPCDDGYAKADDGNCYPQASVDL